METVLTNQKAFDSFILASQIEGKAERTIEQYYRVLKHFFADVDKQPIEITSTDIREYLNRLSKQGFAQMTVWTYYKQLSVFFKFLLREGYIAGDPLKLIAKPKTPKIFPKILTDNEVRLLLRSSKGSGFMNKRNQALLVLTFDCGLRASEVCSLKLTDISFPNLIVKVYGKGSKERIVPFSRETGKVLMAYLKVRGNPPFEDSFFITRTGKRLDRYRFRRILKELAQKAAIDPKRVSPHVLRHTFATTWIRAGGDVKRLQHILGHSDPRVVECYVHLTAKDLSEAHAKFSPMQKITGRG